MRLRYLHVGRYPPLADLTVRFASGSPLQELLERACAIRFVVGLNGSGKSHILRAVADVFLALADQSLPGFAASLIYELGPRGSTGERTVLLDCPGAKHQASLWIAERFHWPDDTPTEDFEQAIQTVRTDGPDAPAGFSVAIARGEWPQRVDAALPRAVLAYTTGAPAPWEALWQPPQDATDLDLVTQAEDYDATRERPPGWTGALEATAFGVQRGPTRTGDFGDGSNAAASLFRRPILLDSVLLKCALLAVTVQEFARVRRAESPNPKLAQLLARGGWHSAVGVRFQVRLQATETAPRGVRQALHDLLLTAGEVIRDPHPVEARRAVYFDFDGPFEREGATFLSNSRIAGSRNQGEALANLLGEPTDTAFERFGQAVVWRQAGLFDDLELFLRRVPKPADSETCDDLGVLRYSELSDGEQMVLGRMALFHLLEGQDDALLLLDEPETHFNDKWKREIVDIIDEAIGKQANDVLIATHSAIVLSDVFNDEIIKVERAGQQSHARAVPTQTFASDPSALMMTVFDAEDSIGRRAQQFIEKFLATSAAKPQPTAEDIRRLETLIAHMGSGFYRSELRTLLNRWKPIESDRES